MGQADYHITCGAESYDSARPGLNLRLLHNSAGRTRGRPRPLPFLVAAVSCASAAPALPRATSSLPPVHTCLSEIRSMIEPHIVLQGCPSTRVTIRRKILWPEARCGPTLRASSQRPAVELLIVSLVARCQIAVDTVRKAQPSQSEIQANNCY